MKNESSIKSATKTAIYELDGEYKVLCIVDTEEKYERVKDYLEKHADRNKSRGAIQEWAEKSLRELNEGRDEIGECWKITITK